MRGSHREAGRIEPKTCVSSVCDSRKTGCQLAASEGRERPLDGVPVQARAHLEIVEDVVGVVEVGEGLGVDGE